MSFKLFETLSGPVQTDGCFAILYDQSGKRYKVVLNKREFVAAAGSTIYVTRSDRNGIEAFATNGTKVKILSFAEEAFTMPEATALPKFQQQEDPFVSALWSGHVPDNRDDYERSRRLGPSSWPFSL